MNLFQEIIDLVRGKKRLTLTVTASYEYKKLYKNYRNISERIKQKERQGKPIKVGLLITSNDSANPFMLYLYRRFESDPRFEPYVVIAPYTHLSIRYMMETTREMIDFLKGEKCRFISGYDFEREGMVDIKDFFADSLLFSTDPYSNLTDVKFIFKNFIDSSLTYYIPYSYCIATMVNCVSMDPQKYAYKIFVETALHRDMVKKYSPIKGANLADFVGYLGSQRLLEERERHYEWKCPRSNMKKVIIAPHHLLGYGNFLRFHQFFLDIANQYREKISFVFKPHPVFRETVLKYWSAKEIDSYLEEWNRMPNTKLELGDYENLFFTSDAMILDSISFCAEYTLLNKPLFFIEQIPPHQFNPVGKEILKQQYSGNSFEEVSRFIDDIVLSGDDGKKVGRKQFSEKNLLPPHRDIAENIYEYVLNDVGILPAIKED